MRAAAPGKLVLTGAYAVLEGAPAIVMAVDRYARADASRSAESPSAEVREALGDGAPHCDVSELSHAGQKLGLGSSAAGLVASLAAVQKKRGADPEDPDVRARIFSEARAAHAAVQGGGSGVDVAASTYGGVLRYSLLPTGAPSTFVVNLPEGLVLSAFFSGRSARTSDLRAGVEAFREHDAARHRKAMNELGEASDAAAGLLASGGVGEAVKAIRAFGEALERLGDAADVPIVPLEFRRLATTAVGEDAWFLPSGAGGGDVGLYCGRREPSEAFVTQALTLGMTPLTLAVSTKGVHSDSRS